MRYTHREDAPAAEQLNMPHSNASTPEGSACIAAYCVTGAELVRKRRDCTKQATASQGGPNCS